MEGIRQSIMKYQPVNEQEEKDRLEMLALMGEGKDLLTRDNQAAHFTVSGWVVSPDRKMTLLVYHNIYDSWSWLGGHADGEEDLASVALKEVREESGLEKVRLLSENPVSLEILPVSGHVKRGRYVSSHIHLNVTYLLEADPEDPPRIKEDENSGVGWFPLEEVLERSSEPWFVERIYPKLIQRSKEY